MRKLYPAVGWRYQRVKHRRVKSPFSQDSNPNAIYYVLSVQTDSSGRVLVALCPIESDGPWVHKWKSVPVEGKEEPIGVRVDYDTAGFLASGVTRSVLWKDFRSLRISWVIEMWILRFLPVVATFVAVTALVISIIGSPF